jgi:hypothetical protein
VDERGNLVKQDYQIKTLAANVASVQAKKKKENPYLAHRTPAVRAKGPEDGTASVLPPEMSEEKETPQPAIPIVNIVYFSS